MLYNKKQIINKISSLLNYSISQNEKHADEYPAFTNKLKSAVNDYFNNHDPKLSETIRELVFNVYCDLVERLTVTERTYGDPLPTNYPNGYNDLTECFYQFPLMTTTEQQFHAAWVYDKKKDGNGNIVYENSEPVLIVVRNTLIDNWIDDLVQVESDDTQRATGEKTYIANDNDFKAVQDLLNWVQNSASLNQLPQLLEDWGATTSTPDTQEVGRNIYIDKKYLDVIEHFSLNVYIPSYIQGG